MNKHYKHTMEYNESLPDRNFPGRIYEATQDHDPEIAFWNLPQNKVVHFEWLYEGEIYECPVIRIKNYVYVLEEFNTKSRTGEVFWLLD